MLKGIAVSSGIVVGKVYKLVQPEIVLKEEKGETSAELAAFKAAVAKTRTDIEKIKEKSKTTFLEKSYENMKRKIQRKILPPSIG